MSARTNPSNAMSPLPPGGSADRPQLDPAVLAQLWPQRRRRPTQQRRTEKLSQLWAWSHSPIDGSSLVEWSAADLERWFDAWAPEGLNFNPKTDDEPFHPTS
jgi:hypothetical protein